MVRETQFVLSFDRWVYLQALNLSSSMLWLKFWYGITTFGNGPFVYLIATLLSVVILFRYRSLKSFGFVALLIAVFLINPILKGYFALERPIGLAPFYPLLKTFTFPSGHAVNAVVLCYFISRVYRDLFYPRMLIKNRLFRIITIIGIFLIASSRVFLGVHWVSDVVGGVCLGAFLCTFAYDLFCRLKLGHQKKTDGCIEIINK